MLRTLTESDGLATKIKRSPYDTHAAHLDYYGEPHEDDDPADYYNDGIRGVLIA